MGPGTLVDISEEATVEAAVGWGSGGSDPSAGRGGRGPGMMEAGVLATWGMPSVFWITKMPGRVGGAWGGGQRCRMGSEERWDRLWGWER